MIERAAAPPLEAVEIDLLLDGIYQVYGYDFRDYSRSSMRRRIRDVLHSEGIPTVSLLQDRVLHDAGALGRLLDAFSVNVTSLFRDPPFYDALWRVALPILAGRRTIRIWDAGCASGEEVYSLAITLQEAGLYDRSLIFGTDISAPALTQAKAGSYPEEAVVRAGDRYLASGGRRQLAAYFDVADGVASFKGHLRRNVVFAEHNLTVDRSFNEFQLIVCRNVLIYFNPPLQEHVHDLLFDSLAAGGILALGLKESLGICGHAELLAPLCHHAKLFRRVG